MQTPDEKSWNTFWSRQGKPPGAAVSWSKRRILRVLEPYALAGRRALDAGCGSGFFSNFFCDRGMQTVSLDYSDEALAMAGRTTGGRSRPVKADLIGQDLSALLPEPFDLIFSDGLFEHFSSDVQDRIMSNLKRVCAPDGVIVTFVPNRFSPWEMIRPFYMPGIDERPFVLSELRALNDRNGLRVEKQGGVNTLPFCASPEFVAPLFGMLLYTVGRPRGRE